jgi:hypothetical protein
MAVLRAGTVSHSAVIVLLIITVLRMIQNIIYYAGLKHLIPASYDKNQKLLHKIPVFSHTPGTCMTII